ncbi:hypothetical protein [Neobacillus sp. FSL H8-0543]|uniref:hypothetical protein n=1 Tax=Neobacillus sp. FSL H8-0543 TaxID=2954672 RepID=UPI0031595970
MTVNIIKYPKELINDEILIQGCVKDIVDLVHSVDWSGRHEELLENATAFPSCGEYSRKPSQCPAGVRGWGDPTGALAPRRLTGTPAESEVPGAPINRPVSHSKKKTVICITA